MAVTEIAGVAAVLKEIELQSKREFLPIVGPVKGKLLTQLVAEYSPNRVVEVGALVGYSAILVASHLPEDSAVTSLEVDRRVARIARDNVARAGLSDKVNIIVGDANETIPTLSDFFQFAFIDAAKEEYINYLKLLEPMLAAGSIIVADNAGVFPEAMASYLKYVRSSGKYRSQFYDFGFDGMEVSIKLR